MTIPCRSVIIFDSVLHPGDSKREDLGLPSRKEMEMRHREKAEAGAAITEGIMRRWMKERCVGLGRCMVGPFGSRGCRAYPACYKVAAKIRALIGAEGKRQRGNTR